MEDENNSPEPKEQQAEENNQQPDLASFQSNINSQLEAMSKQQQEYLNSLANMVVQQNKQPEPQQTYEEGDFYSLSPEEYKTRIKEELRQEIKQEISKSESAQASRQATLATLQTEFPEISDASSDFAKKMIEVHNSLPAALKETGQGYELAARSAASQLGVVPKRLRQEDKGDINIQGRKPPAKRKDGKVHVSDTTLAIAKLLGRDVSDPNVIKGLEEASGRDNFKKYR